MARVWGGQKWSVQRSFFFLKDVNPHITNPPLYFFVQRDSSHTANQQERMCRCWKQRQMEALAFDFYIAFPDEKFASDLIDELEEKGVLRHCAVFRHILKREVRLHNEGKDDEFVGVPHRSDYQAASSAAVKFVKALSDTELMNRRVRQELDRVMEEAKSDERDIAMRVLHDMLRSMEHDYRQ
jgi:predicted amidophosphoribosyltransferase